MSGVFKTEMDWSKRTQITEYSGNDETVVIPSDVYEIQNHVFKGHTEIKEVVFPEGLGVIGWGAFEGCTGIEEITVPSSVGLIQNHAFLNCCSLARVNLPETFNSFGFSMFGDQAFSGCTSLKEIEFPEAYDVFPGKLFEGCTSLSKIVMKNRSAKIYGKEKRDVCEALQKIAIPEQLETPVIKRQLMSLAAKNILSGDCDEVYKAAWIKYIKAQRKPCIDLIRKDKYLSEFVIKEKILTEKEFGAEQKEVIEYDISYKEAIKKYSITKRKTGYSINDFNKDGRIDGPLGEDWHYEFSRWSKDPSKVVFIPDTIDGKAIGHVAVKTLPFDAIVQCSAANFAKLDVRIRACTSVAYLEDSSPFKKDEEAKIMEFIKKSSQDVARALIKSDVPAAYSKYLELAEPDKDTVRQIIDAVMDKKEIVAILLNAVGQEDDSLSLEIEDKKPKSVREVKKEWNYDKQTVYTDNSYKETITGVVLKKYKGINPDVEVPDVISKNPVIVIGKNAFENNREAVSVSIPDSVKIIENRAFSGCKNLKKVFIQGSGVWVKDGAFADCSELSEVVVDIRSTRFGEHVFKNCSKLFDDRGLAIMDSILVDSKWPYDYPEVIIPEGISEIAEGAFADQHDYWDRIRPHLIIRRVVLPATVRKIGAGAFAKCSTLQDVVMPEGLEKIGANAFSGCTMLREIHIPASVNEFEIRNVWQCPFDQHRKLTIYGYPGSQAEKYANEQGFAFVKEDPTAERKELVVDFVVEDGVLTNYLGNDADIVIPEGVTSIEDRAFDHKKIRSVIIPEGVTRIGEYAFADCVDLETVKIPGSVVNIENHAFIFCHSLKNVELSEGLKTIGESAFGFCALEEITIPASVEKISSDAFNQCQRLTRINNLSKAKIE